MSTSTRSQAIDAVLADAVSAGAVPNVVAVAADRDDVIYQGAAGPRAPGEEATVNGDTPLRIMSMTKPVVTVAALHLAEQRKLDIDAPVEEYCPEFAAIGLLERIDDGAARCSAHRRTRSPSSSSSRIPRDSATGSGTPTFWPGSRRWARPSR